MSDIQHVHLHGTRDSKYEWLLNHDVSSTTWTELVPQKPFHLFIPQNNDLLGEYQACWKITDIMPVNSVRIVTARDSLIIHWTKEKVWETVRDFALLDPEVAREKYDLGKDSSDWRVTLAQDDLKKAGLSEQNLAPILYRPFDIRYTYYTGKSGGFHCRSRGEVMKHIVSEDNLGLVFMRQVAIQEEYSHFVVTNNVIDNRAFYSNKGIMQISPLYLYPKYNSLTQKSCPNFSPNFLKGITTQLGYTPTPEAIFYCIYAVFHSPTYRSRYAQFLKIDFPRVPLTGTVDLFRQLSAYGEALVALHLMKFPKLDTLITQFVDAGGDRAVDPGHPKYDESSSSVLINKKGDKFTGVPKAIWEFYVGGYQVCQKWLKDRKGRTLTPEDITHYQRIVVALQETMRLMQQIDEAIPRFSIE